jgi:Putative Actinobacterial Holin-X, holin superfamily III/PRC-barrel domain
MAPEQGAALDWEGQTVVDRGGDKIGTLEEVFLVEETGRPEWGLVKIGRIKSHTTLVPLTRAHPVREGIKLAYDKQRVQCAPKIDPGDEPSEQQVDAVYRHYGIDLAEGQSANAEHTDARARCANVNGSPDGSTDIVNGSGGDLRQEPVADLVKQVRDEAQTLVGQEIKLAKAEMTEKAKQIGVGAGMVGGAGYLGHLATLGLMLCLIFALATFLPGWLAALIVTVVFAAGAGALALAGRKRIQEAGPPVPEETVESVKQTIEIVKEEARWGLGQTR